MNQRQFFRHILFLGVSMVCCVVLYAGPAWSNNREAAPEPGETPNLSMPYTVVDLGEIDQGGEAAATFHIRNKGNVTLMIDHLMASDSNAALELTQHALGPSEEGILRCVLDTSNIQGKTSINITFDSNDPKHSVMALKVTAVVRPLLALETTLIFAGQVAKDAAFSKAVDLHGKLIREGKSDGLKIRVSSPGIQAMIVKKKDKDGIVPILQIVLQPEMKAGTFQEEISVVSIDPPAEARLVVVGQKLGDIHVEPDQLAFFSAQDSDPGSRTVLLESQKIFHIKKIEDLTGLLDLSVKTLEPGKRYKITATIQKGMFKGDTFFGLVQVHTDLVENPLIDLPVLIGKTR